VTALTLLDVVAPASPPSDPRVRMVIGDLTDPRIVEEAVPADTDSIFHLAAVVSGAAEADFDLGMRVNLDATRLLLERCRALTAPPKLVFTSSLAVFGGVLPNPVTDDAPLKPQTSYGTQKAIGELLVYDMTRKGYIDGRSLRLPTITVRPASPTRRLPRSRAASSASRSPAWKRSAPCPRTRACGCRRRGPSSRT
jgi:nucleoside-diphosphate-sugar epimerase